jgi:hypothetical protein
VSDVSLEDLSVSIDAAKGVAIGQREWRITWTIGNRSNSLLSINEIRIPHDQFRGVDLGFNPPIQIPPKSSGTITTIVQYSEPPGSTLTYPFVIARAHWNDLPCRLFGRLRVEADEQGSPRTTCEEVTVQPVSSGQ